MKALVAALVVITGLGMICEKDKDRAINLTAGFMVSVISLAIMVVN